MCFRFAKAYPTTLESRIETSDAIWPYVATFPNGISAIIFKIFACKELLFLDAIFIFMFISYYNHQISSYLNFIRSGYKN